MRKLLTNLGGAVSNGLHALAGTLQQGAGRLGKWGAAKSAAAAGKLKVFLLLPASIPVFVLILVLPLMLVVGGVFGSLGSEPAPEPRKRKPRQTLASKAAAAALALFSLAVAGALVFILYSHVKVENLTIAAGPDKSEAYVMMQALATVAARHDYRLKIMVHQTAGGADSLDRLERGDAQLAAVPADTLASAKANLVAVLYEDALQLLVHKDAELTQFADLKGKKIALPRNSGAYQAFIFLASRNGMKESDFSFAGGDDPSALDAFEAKNADAIFRVRSVHDADITKLVRANAVVLPIEHAAAIHSDSPGDLPGVIPIGAYQGNPPLPPEDVPTVVTQRLLVARDDAGKDAIYGIAQVLMENREEIFNAIPEASRAVRTLVAQITEPALSAGGLSLAVHPGALAYYDRGRKSFVVENADLLCLLAAALVLVWLWKVYRGRLEGNRQKDLWTQLNTRMMKLADEARAAPSEQALAAVEKDLTATMASCLTDLNAGKMSDASFPSLQAAWQVAGNTVRERRIELAQVNLDKSKWKLGVLGRKSS